MILAILIIVSLTFTLTLFVSVIMITTWMSTRKDRKLEALKEKINKEGMTLVMEMHTINHEIVELFDKDEFLKQFCISKEEREDAKGLFDRAAVCRYLKMEDIEVDSDHVLMNYLIEKAIKEEHMKPDHKAVSLLKRRNEMLTKLENLKKQSEGI